MVLISELPTRRGVSLLAGIDPRWEVCQRVSVGEKSYPSKVPLVDKQFKKSIQGQFLALTKDRTAGASGGELS